MPTYLKCSNCLNVNLTSTNISYCEYCAEETAHIPNIINLTPHPLNLKWGESIYSYPSEGIATVQFEYKESQIAVINAGIPIPISVINLPPATHKVLYFVSAILRSSLPNRIDLISPSTKREDIVRDEKGNIIAILAFDSNF